MLDKTPSEPRETIELRASRETKQAAAGETIQDQINAAMNALEQPAAAAAAAAGISSGAAAAAGVLTAVDEDEEGAEEAPVPNEFDYHSDTAEE